MEWRAALDRKRAKYLRTHGPEMAATFDYIYGYGSSGCGQNRAYYAQFEAHDDAHCKDRATESHAEQVDRYRGLRCTQLRGWDERLQRAQASCCSFPGSCNGTLPYPYAQAQLTNCDPDYARFTEPGCASCGAERPRRTWALDQPKQYNAPPYAPDYYLHSNLWPYGEQAPTRQDIGELQRTRQQCSAASCSKSQHTSSL